MGISGPPRQSVVVVTYERPVFLVRCLEGLARDLDSGAEVVVVDASAQRAERAAQAAYPGLIYVHAPELGGRMTASRNEGLLHTSGDVISFIDDDVVVHPGWSHAVRTAFAETGAAAVAGRTLNGIPGEEDPNEPVGSLTEEGRLTAGFGAAGDGRIPVQHGIGANMSFSREILATLGGFRDDYPGTALREDTDIFLRLNRLNELVLFDPAAAVDHLPAPHVKGQRFDTRYKLYGRRNHMVLLARHAGVGSPLMRRWVAGQMADVVAVPGIRRKTERLGVTVLGLAWGALAVGRSGNLQPADPVRRDAQADRIRSALSGSGSRR